MNTKDIIKVIEDKYPVNLAYDWDNVGLMIGSYNLPVKKVLIALDLTKKVLEEAINNKINLIITHHPFIFTPIMNINFDTVKGHMIKDLITNKITVYSMHTNFDCNLYGMNYVLATKLGLKNQEMLDDEEKIGVIGDLEEGINITDFIRMVKDKFNLPDVKYYGKEEKMIKKVGISGGSGSKHIGVAKRKNCDVYLTGDITYHTALDIHSLGLNVIDINHYAENVFTSYMKDFLNSNFSDLEVMTSEVDVCPYKLF